MIYDLKMRGEELGNRFRALAIKVARFINSLPKTQSNLVYGKQILRSSSSIGANYSEAIYAHSRQDFIHCLNISRKETNETLYWLHLLRDTNQINLGVDELIDETQQILKILVSSVKTAKNNKS